MFKKILFAVILSGFAFSSFACSRSLDPDHPDFCASFKAACKCYCTAAGFPGLMCENMTDLFSRMMAVYGSLDTACRAQVAQHNVPAADCLDDWNCYMFGGVDSRGRICSSNYAPCPR